MSVPPNLDPQRLWGRLNREGPTMPHMTTPCWVWTGRSTHTAGYGLLSWRGKLVGAHRLAFTLANGSVPKGAMVTHDCDNPACCRPDHLRLGTALSNTREAWARGRCVTPFVPPERRCRGARVNTARLTESDVVAIRVRLGGGESITTLARDFGVTKQNIVRIRDRQTWAHIPEEAPNAVQ